MDKYYQLEEMYHSLIEDFLEDYDISFVDVLAALDNSGVIDVDEIIMRMRYNIEEDEENAWET